MSEWLEMRLNQLGKGRRDNDTIIEFCDHTGLHLWSLLILSQYK